MLDPAAISWLASDKALIEIDRELVKRGGFRMFVELAWPIIEPGVPFVGNWHIDAICSQLQDVSLGTCRRQLFGIPPRHSKSTLVSVLFPAWDWIDHPERRFLYASYNENLATRDNVRTRRVVEHPWFRERWGDKFFIAKDQNTKTKFENNKTGSREVTSVNGQTTGIGADIIVLDDPNNVTTAESPAVREATLLWWNEALPTRLNDQRTGAFVVVQQRVNEGDVIGDTLKRHRGQWRYLCLPAEYDPQHPHLWPLDPRTEPGELLWPARFPADVIDRLKVSLGPYAAAAQLQQLPAPREGGLFKKHWFPKVTLAELPGDLEYCRGWDFAATTDKIVKADPDWTATVKIGHSFTTKKWYIVHAERWRVEGGEVNRILKATAEADVKEHGNRIRYRLPQDPGAAGKTLAQTHATLIACLPFMIEAATGDKAVNAAPLAGQAMIGNVLMLNAPWNDDFITEYTGFPTGSHDDMVDAGSQAFKGFIVGNTGILDYYTRKLEEQKKAQAQLGPQPLDGGTVEATDNLAKALIR